MRGCSTSIDNQDDDFFVAQNVGSDKTRANQLIKFSLLSMMDHTRSWNLFLVQIAKKNFFVALLIMIHIYLKESKMEIDRCCERYDCD